MLMCDEVGSDVHALMKELATRRVEDRSATHSDESQHLVEGTEVARLWQQFSFALQRAFSFRARPHLCRQGVALASTRQIRSQRPVSIHAHCTKGVTGFEGREGGIRVGTGSESGAGTETGTGSGVGSRTRTLMETETERERVVATNEGTQDKSGDGSGDGDDEGGDQRTNSRWERGQERDRKREQ